MKIEDVTLGKKYRDVVTGFEGIAVGKSDWLTGCSTVGLSPPIAEGEKKPTEWFDVMRVDPVLSEDDFSYLVKNKAVPDGGPQMTPQRGLS